MKREKPSYEELQQENEQLRKLLSVKNAEAKSFHDNHLNFIQKIQLALDSYQVPQNNHLLHLSGISGTVYAANPALADSGPTGSEKNRVQNQSQGKTGSGITEVSPDFSSHWSIPIPEYRFLLNEALKIPGILPGNTNEKLMEQDEWNASLLNILPFGINVIDEEGNILYQSDTISKTPEAGPANNKCWTVLCDSKTQCSGCPLIEGIQVGKTSNYETSGMAGGKTFHISQTGMMYKGKKALLEVFQDVTEKKEIKKKVRLLAQALESIQECVSITDRNDQIIYINDSFRKTYGYSKNELIGQNIQIVRPSDIRHLKVRDILTKTLDGGWRGEIMNRKKDGTLFPVLLSSSAIKDEQGNLTALIGVAMDISEMRRTSEELLLAKEQAEESNRLKTALLNNLSHEIRTPMNAIMGFSNLLPDATSDEKIAYSEIIKKSSGHLLNMLDDVILISRLQSEKLPLNITDCQPVDMISHVYRMFQHAELNKGLAIRMKTPETGHNLVIRADEDKIVQVLTNLVSNAVKYTMEGSVEIGFAVLPGYVEFYVEDTGIGISQKELKMIFDNFYRGEQALKYAIRGHGLGLCITRELVELMGGTIDVTSMVKKGSRFYFTVPLLRPLASSC